MRHSVAKIIGIGGAKRAQSKRIRDTLEAGVIWIEVMEVQSLGMSNDGAAIGAENAIVANEISSGAHENTQGDPVSTRSKTSNGSRKSFYSEGKMRNDNLAQVDVNTNIVDIQSD